MQDQKSSILLMRTGHVRNGYIKEMDMEMTTSTFIFGMYVCMYILWNEPIQDNTTDV